MVDFKNLILGIIKILLSLKPLPKLTIPKHPLILAIAFNLPPNVPKTRYFRSLKNKPSYKTDTWKKNLGLKTHSYSKGEVSLFGWSSHRLGSTKQEHMFQFA